ncbi:hypothetical protein GC169_10185 [bacterium]|nr:hypothetical protein [bacterium]
MDPEQTLWRRRGYIAAGCLFAAWAFLPPLTMPNISHDAAEGLIWGRGWDLGYPKHPPLQAWLLEAARLVFGTGSFAHVWLSALCVAVCHLAVQRAGEYVLDPRTAFWASASLQTVYYVNYTTPEFNPNVLQLPAYALAGWFAIRVLTTGAARDWLVLGLVLGAGMYTKYSAALIAVSIAAFFLVDPEGRKRLMSPWPFAGAVLALLVFAPHLWWLATEGAPSLTYAVDRAQIAPSLPSRVANIGEFAGTMIAVSLPLALVIALSRERSKRPQPPSTFQPSDARRRLVFWLVLTPIATTACMALIAGFRIKAAWLAPFWTFAPLAAFLLFRVDAHAARWRGGRTVVVVMAALGLVAYLGVNTFRPYLQHKPMRIHFPGAALAEQVDAAWRERFDTPLKVVIGDTLAAGSAAHYSAFEPMVRVGDVETDNPWAPEAMVQASGAVILWDAGRFGDALPPEIAARRPTAQITRIVTLPHQTGADVPPARIGIAIVPPAVD